MIRIKKKEKVKKKKTAHRLLYYYERPQSANGIRFIYLIMEQRYQIEMKTPERQKTQMMGPPIFAAHFPLNGTMIISL